MPITDISKVEISKDGIKATDGLGVEEPRDVRSVGSIEDSGASLNVRLAKQEDFLQAIRNAVADVTRARGDVRVAREMLKEEIEQLDAWVDHEAAKEAVKRATDELEAQKAESAEVEQATDTLDTKQTDLAAKQALLSDLLVLYAAKFNSKTVEVEQRQPRLILLSAKLGKVEPEQLRLF